MSDLKAPVGLGVVLLLPLLIVGSFRLGLACEDLVECRRALGRGGGQKRVEVEGRRLVTGQQVRV